MLKQSAKKIIVQSNVLRCLHSMVPRRVAILRYHSIFEPNGAPPRSIPREISHTADEFESHMRLIAREFQPVTLGDVVEGLGNNFRTLPRRSVVVSFDDGYKDNATLAAPRMNAAGIQGVFYIMAGAIESAALPWFCRSYYAFRHAQQRVWTDPETGRQYRLDQPDDNNAARLAVNRRCASSVGDVQERFLQDVERQLGTQLDAPTLMMDWNDIRQLRESGHDVGAHTMTHPNLALVSLESAENELKQSKCRLEAELGCPVDHFSYPNPIGQPHWSAETNDAVRAAGFRSSVTSTPGPVLAGADPYCIRRLAVPATARELKWTLDKVFAGFSR